MNAQDWLNLAISRLDQSFVAWNFLLVVSLGLIGFLAKVESRAMKRTMRLPLLGGFLVFAGANLWLLCEFRRQKDEFLGRAQELLSEPLVELVSRPLVEMVLLHLAFDMVVVAVLLSLSKRGAEKKVAT